ncbi:uncharacterized protein [Diadema antillarum]|uniref:uncharacterized protein n=1 Tax=Diadema antillarum TaxID=105358 RepID=UPI003A83C5A1
MRAIVQRVTKASVSVGDELVSSIGRGLCILVGISRDDSPKEREYLARKILNLRLFDDDNEKRWTKSVKDKQLEILCVSQFTLYSVLKGNKPDFHQAMPGEQSQAFYNEFLALLRRDYDADKVKDGRFGAYMQVQIQNDGPVTIQLESPQDTTPPAPEDTAAASKEVLRQARQEELRDEVNASNEGSPYHPSSSGSGHFESETRVKTESYLVCCVCRFVRVAADGSDRATTMCGSCGEGLHQECSIMHQCRLGANDLVRSEPGNQENSQPQVSYASSGGSSASRIVIQQATKLCVECSKGGAVNPCWGCKQNLHWECRNSHVCPPARSQARPTLSQLLQGKFSKVLHQSNSTQALSGVMGVGNHKVKFRLERYRQKKDCCVCSVRRLGIRRRTQTVCFYCKKGLHWDCRLKHDCDMYGMEPVQYQQPMDDGESMVVSLGGGRHGGRRDCCVCSIRRLGQRHRARTICKFCKKGLHRKCEHLHMCVWRKRIQTGAAANHTLPSSKPNQQDVNAAVVKKVQKGRGIHAGIKTVLALSRHTDIPLPNQGGSTLHPFPSGESHQGVAPVTSQAVSLEVVQYQSTVYASQGQSMVYPSQGQPTSGLTKAGPGPSPGPGPGISQEENNINSSTSLEVRTESYARGEPRIVRVRLLGNRDGRRDCIVCSSRTNGGQRKRSYTMCSICKKGLHSRCLKYHMCGLTKLHPKYDIPNVSSTVLEPSAVAAVPPVKENDMEVVEEEKEAEVVIKEEKKDEEEMEEVEEDKEVEEEKEEEAEEGWVDAGALVPAVETMTCLPDLIRIGHKMNKECVECFLYDGFKKQASLMCSVCKRGVHKKCHYWHRCGKRRDPMEEQDANPGNDAQVQHTGTFVGERPSVELISYDEMMDSKKACEVCSGRGRSVKRNRSRTQCAVCKKGLHLRCLSQHICPGPEYARQNEINSLAEPAPSVQAAAFPADMGRLWQHEVVVIKPRDDEEEEMRREQGHGQGLGLEQGLGQGQGLGLVQGQKEEVKNANVEETQPAPHNGDIVPVALKLVRCNSNDLPNTSAKEAVTPVHTGMFGGLRPTVEPIRISDVMDCRKNCEVCSGRAGNGRRNRSRTQCSICKKGLHQWCLALHICPGPEDVRQLEMLTKPHFKDRRLKNSRLVKKGKEKTCCVCHSPQKTRMACPGCAQNVHFRCEASHQCHYFDASTEGMVGMGMPFTGEVVPIEASEIKTRKKDCAVCSDRRGGRRSRSNTKCPQCDKGLHRACARQHICTMFRAPQKSRSQVIVLDDDSERGEEQEEQEDDDEESPGLVEVKSGAPKYCCVCSSSGSQHPTQTACSSCERGLHPHCLALHNCSSLVPQLPPLMPRYVDTDADANVFGDRHEALLDGRGGGSTGIVVVKDEKIEPVVQTQAPVSPRDKRRGATVEFGAGVTCICLCRGSSCEGERCGQKRLLVTDLGTSETLDEDEEEEAGGTSHMESTVKSGTVSEVATQDMIVDGEQVFLLNEAKEHLLPNNLEGMGGLSENGRPARLNKAWVSTEYGQRLGINDLDELHVSLEGHNAVQFKDIDVIVAKIEEELHQAEEVHDQGIEWSEVDVSAS